MSKSRKRCYFCRCVLTNQNKTLTTSTREQHGYRDMIWIDCCHTCKFKQDKKP
jgi:hypothetical protein